MPIYEVDHACALSEKQQDQLAEAITKIHTTLFTTPSSFVHVVFHHVSTPTYMAGKRRKSNIVRANIRPGAARTQEQYQSLCNSIHAAWRDAVGNGDTDESKLRAIFVLGTIISGWEGGFMIPEAGKDQEWLQENLPEMEKTAEKDQDIKEMLEELRTRTEFQHIFPH